MLGFLHISINTNQKKNVIHTRQLENNVLTYAGATFVKQISQTSITVLAAGAIAGFIVTVAGLGQ